MKINRFENTTNIMPRPRRHKATPPAATQDFNLYHAALESSPSVQRFLASIPPLEKQQCLRVALVQGIRHFLQLQLTQNTKLNYSTMHAALHSTDALNSTPTVAAAVRRPVQPGRTLAAFPFVDESRFETRSLRQARENDPDGDGVANLYDVDDDAENTAKQAISPPPAVAASAVEAGLAPPNVVFAQYPNWWPLEDSITPDTMKKTKASAKAAVALAEAQVAAKVAALVAATKKAEAAAAAAAAAEQRQQRQERQQRRPVSVVRSFDPNEHPPQRTEIPWKSNERPALWEPKHRVQPSTNYDATHIDETLLVDRSKPNMYKPFKARKIPTFKKKNRSSHHVKPPKYATVQSKIGSEIKQYRVAARRAKIRANEATDRVMESYAAGINGQGQRKGASIEVSTLASAIVDSGIMADLLATVPGPTVELCPPPTRKEDSDRPTYDTIMREIEMEAALESKSPQRGGRGGTGEETPRSNYSSWVGDFGPDHTRTMVNPDDAFVVG